MLEDWLGDVERVTMAHFVCRSGEYHRDLREGVVRRQNLYCDRTARTRKESVNEMLIFFIFATRRVQRVVCELASGIRDQQMGEHEEEMSTNRRARQKIATFCPATISTRHNSDG